MIWSERAQWKARGKKEKRSTFINDSPFIVPGSIHIHGSDLVELLRNGAAAVAQAGWTRLKVPGWTSCAGWSTEVSGGFPITQVSSSFLLRQGSRANL